jgi:hypothetical protein
MPRLSSAFVLFSIILTLFVPGALVLAQPTLELLNYWSYSVSDVAVSADGQYVAAINQTALLFFSVDSPSPRWIFDPSNMTQSMDILAVEISADGQYVMIGYGGGSDNGGVSYFNESTSRNGVVQDPTWTHWFLKSAGAIARDCTAMSDDGEHVTVAGTGNTVYCFTNCTSKSGERASVGGGLEGFIDWYNTTIAQELICLDITPDGRYIAAGGYLSNSSLYVAFLDSETESMSWQFVGQNGTVQDIAASDNGSTVFAGYSYYDTILSEFGYGVSYWNASSSLLGDNPAPSWWWDTQPEPADWKISVAISSNGDRVVSGDQEYTTFNIWSNATTLSGETFPPISWGTPTLDLAISGNGEILAVSEYSGIPEESPSLFVYNIEDENGASFDLSGPCELVSMSSNGEIIAVAGEEASLYILRLGEVVPFAIVISPSTVRVTQGDSTTITAAVDLVGNSSGVVTLSASGQPAGVLISFDPSSGTPTFTSNMTITVGEDVEPRSYRITITGTSNPEYTTTIWLTVNEPSKPVGGFIAPTIFEFLVPWLRLIAAIGIIAAVAIAIKKIKN